LSVAQLGLVDRKIADNTVSPVSKDRLDEANLQRDAKVKNAEAACRDPSSRIAKPAGRLAIS
jgi:hypothetical protein